MITIAWYNVVAIVVGIVFLVWMNSSEEEHGYLAGLGGALVLILMIFFYAIWGGIFWW